MDNPTEIVKCVARIWRIYKRQESLCCAAMRLEMPCKFRCLLGGGYLLFTLYRNEVGRIYDEVKCILNDGELNSIVRYNGDLLPRQHHRNEYVSQLISGQKELLEAYKNLVCELGEYREAVGICRDHLCKLSELSQKIAAQSEHFSQNEPAVYFSVA